MLKKICKTVLAYLLISCSAFADTPDLNAYINSMDFAEVTFSGRIKYNKSEDSFTFYNDEKEYFSATIDAGRKTRDRIENECENSSFMVNWKDLCLVSGNGTIEIRGSNIHLSVDEILSLEKP